MGRGTYYAPAIGACLLVLIMNESIRAGLLGYSPSGRWLLVVAFALIAGLAAQLLMLGLQGVSAMALPAPGGRSIRGNAARGVGYLLLAAVALAVVGLPLALEYGAVATAGMVLLALAGAALVAALIAYAWAWPAAVQDFADDAPGR
jgi:hypothetical protein